MYTFHSDFFFFLTYEFDLWVANSAWLAVFQAVEKQMPLTFPNYESLCCVLSSVAVYRLTCHPPPAQVGGVTEGWVLAGGRRGWSLWFWVPCKGETRTASPPNSNLCINSSALTLLLNQRVLVSLNESSVYLIIQFSFFNNFSLKAEPLQR